MILWSGALDQKHILNSLKETGKCLICKSKKQHPFPVTWFYIDRKIRAHGETFDKQYHYEVS